MLVFTRQRDQKIVIGGEGTGCPEIVIVVGNNVRVKLAIDAPREVPIVRGEIHHDQARFGDVTAREG